MIDIWGHTMCEQLYQKFQKRGNTGIEFNVLNDYNNQAVIFPVNSRKLLT